jgi:hypothetical protein
MKLIYRTTWCAALVVALATGVGAQSETQPPKRTAAEEKAFQDAVQKQADQIVRERLAAREASRRLGDFELQKQADEERRKIDEEMNALFPLDIEVVISRFQGDKKVSSLPYQLVVNASRQVTRPVTVLRMGGRVPVPTTTISPTQGPDGTFKQFNSWSYENISTQIDCSAEPIGNGRFDVAVSVEDSGLATAPQNVGDGATLPIFRSFQTKNNIVLRDGQTRQFTVAADRLTGETVRVEVTLRVVK